MDALLDAAAASRDPDERTVLLQQVEDLVLADVAIAPVHVYRHRVAVAPTVDGWVLRPDGGVDLTAVRVVRP